MTIQVKKSGFTLIELLVVISIMAILSAIGFVTYNSVLKQGRDAKRQADVRSIQSALEQYRADQTGYPASLPPAGAPFKSPDNSKTYLNQMPQNPLGTAYFYEPVSMSYCLYGNLENTPPAKPPSCANASYNFAVTPP